MSDFFARAFSGGILASAHEAADPLPAGASAADILDAAAAAAPGWHVFADGRGLHLHVPSGTALPYGAAKAAGQGDLAWEAAMSLAPPENGAPLRASVAAASGTSLDMVAVATPLGADAAGLAHALSVLPAPALEPGADAIWDRLGHAARRAQALRGEGRLIAAALAFRGRGRLIGPLRGDLLIRFGVSAWR